MSKLSRIGEESFRRALNFLYKKPLKARVGFERDEIEFDEPGLNKGEFG